MSATRAALSHPACAERSYRKAAAVVLLATFFLLAVACASTEMVRVDTTVPPAPGVDVLAVETTTGQQLDFDPPAGVVEKPEVGFVLEYSELAPFQEREAWFSRTMELETIRRYEVLEQQGPPNWAQAALGAAALAFIAVYVSAR